MKKAYYVVVIGLTRISPWALLVKVRNLSTALAGNPNFPEPVPTLATVNAACEKLDAAIAAYAENPGPMERSARFIAFEEVKGLAMDLGAYIQAASNGDLAKIKSAGCDVRKANAPIGELPAPNGVQAVASKVNGRITVRWNGVHGRSGYNLWICNGDPTVEANWSMLTYTSRNRHVVDGLTSDHTYYFRVTAIGAAGVSAFSDQAVAKAA